MNPNESVPKGRGRGPWQQRPNRKELRRPQTERRIDFPVNTNNAQLDPDAEENISKTSTLSANAKEFYPQNYTSQQSEGSCSSFQFEEATPDGGDCSFYNTLNRTFDTGQELPIDQLIEVIQQLTLNPGKFDVLITPLVDTFGIWLGNAVTASSVVNAIVEQSIKEPNFRYSGARLCNFLNDEYPPGERSTFRSYLLNRCRHEHGQMSNYMHEDPGRLHGYALFIAELFMQLECAKGYGERIEILGKALLEVIVMLLTDPTSGHIKCVCQVLKLAGEPLDEQDEMSMNQVMESLTRLLNSPEVESNVQHLISSVIRLRHIRWIDTSSFMPGTSTTQLCNPYMKNEPVFYGPDGKIMTQEESQFLQESVGLIPDTEEYDDYGDFWEPDDEMDEEIQIAFEQFLKFSSNHSKTTNASDSKWNG